VAFPVVPVNPLAGGRERHRVKKDPNKETRAGEEGNRVDDHREARRKVLLQWEQEALLLWLDVFFSTAQISCMYFFFFNVTHQGAMVNVPGSKHKAQSTSPNGLKVVPFAPADVGSPQWCS